MILNVEKNLSLENDYVDIKYRELTPLLHEIMMLCSSDGMWLIGEANGKQYNIDINDILYIEWVDNRSCICTKDDIYTIPSTLKQLCELLEEHGFIRVSKAFILNVFKIRSISSGLNMKLSVEISNGEIIEISRHYRDGLLDKIHQLAKEQKK